MEQEPKIAKSLERLSTKEKIQYLLDRIKSNLRSLELEAKNVIDNPVGSGKVARENVFSYIDLIKIDIEQVEDLEGLEE